MLANANLPESNPQTSQKIDVRSAVPYARLLSGFTATLLGYDAYFLQIEAQVDLALSRQNGARQ
jgi:hypothetical protein